MHGNGSPLVVVLHCCLVFSSVAHAAAQAVPVSADSGQDKVMVNIDGPPPPIPPAMVARDEQGRVTLRA